MRVCTPCGFILPFEFAFQVFGLVGKQSLLLLGSVLLINVCTFCFQGIKPSASSLCFLSLLQCFNCFSTYVQPTLPVALPLTLHLDVIWLYR